MFLGSPNSTASIRRGVAGGRARAVLPGPRQFRARCLLGVRVDIACWPKDCQFVSHHVSEQPDRWLLCILSAALLACSQLCPESSAIWGMVAVAGPGGQRAAWSTGQVGRARQPSAGPPSCARADRPCSNSGAPRASSRASRPRAPGSAAGNSRHWGRSGRRAYVA
jgi:hypothetical protein